MYQQIILKMSIIIHIQEVKGDKMKRIKWVLLYEKIGKYYYEESGELTLDIKNAIVNYLIKEKEYLIKCGKIVN